MRGGVLGLDLAFSWGWCYIGPYGDYIASGHRVLRSPSNRGKQAYDLQLAISDLVTEYAPDWIAIEQPVQGHYGSSRNLYGYAMIAAMVAHIRETGFVEIKRTSAYSTIVGRGNAKKISGVMFCRERYKPLLNSDDESDSILVALTAHKLRNHEVTA